jgi:predicted nicotinamide N-methyase
MEVHQLPDDHDDSSASNNNNGARCHHQRQGGDTTSDEQGRDVDVDVDSRNTTNRKLLIVSERAQARWSMLRNALLQNSRKQANQSRTTTTTNDANADNAVSSFFSPNKYSIHRFPGYELLQPNTNTNTNSTTHPDCNTNDNSNSEQVNVLLSQLLRVHRMHPPVVPIPHFSLSLDIESQHAAQEADTETAACDTTTTMLVAACMTLALAVALSPSDLLDENNNNKEQCHDQYDCYKINVSSFRRQDEGDEYECHNDNECEEDQNQNSNHATTNEDISLSSCMAHIQEMCTQQYPSVTVSIMNSDDVEKQNSDTTGSTNNDTDKANKTLQLQFSKRSGTNTANNSSMTNTHTNHKYKLCQYVLDDQCCLWTREPNKERRSSAHQLNTISLQDLVSHRTGTGGHGYGYGVDNTGNVCVWDSERTLAYLLYHHFEDFPPFGCDYERDPDSSKQQQQQRVDVRSIMELGTGMAGLAAVSLGLRLVQRQQHAKDNDDDDANLIHANINVNVTLTDGHPDAVLNNRINQRLTAVALSSAKNSTATATTTTDGNTQTQTTHHNVHPRHPHPYQCLRVQCQPLLWTTEWELNRNMNMNHSSSCHDHQQDPQDIILVSDCTHFQNFHAALACTTLKLLCIGGTAIFCQPPRGDSLQNFMNVLSTTTTASTTAAVGDIDKDDTIIHTPTQHSHTTEPPTKPLLSWEWWTHPVVTQKHEQALQEYPPHDAHDDHNDAHDHTHNMMYHIYDPNLHRPKILLVRKLRELTEHDAHAFVAHQQERERA